MKKFSLYCLILPFLIFLNSCNRNEDLDNTPEPDPIIELPKEGISVKTSVFGRIVDEKDTPLSGVLVSGGGLTAVTDVNGVFILTDAMLDQARAYITATKTGYFKGSRIFRPVKDGMSKPPLIKLLAQKSIGTINATAGGTVQSPGGIKVEIPANALEGYSGQVNVVAAYINPNSPDFFARMPGDLGADNKENKRGGLISFGMCDIDLLDDNGNKVKIKPGMQVTVSSPVPQGLQQYATTNIDMWNFDETTGIWKHIGVGTYQNGVYTGKVSHFSSINWDHWSTYMVIPIIFRWILPNITSMPPDDLDHIVNNPPDFIMQVRDKKTGNTLYTTTLPPLTPNTVSPYGGSLRSSIPIPALTSNMEVTVQPVQPGSSPEILVRVRDNKITIRPIAGTRPRGRNFKEDNKFQKELLNDKKEISEHLMLLDLGRNDVGKVSKIGTVKVDQSFKIEKYSHVMHIVSNVVGDFDKKNSLLDTLFSGFPAGTVSGAPKIRAMEIIDDLEMSKRKLYAGGIGYFTPNKEMDTCIALRTALIIDNKIYVQSGAGIVADSIPLNEYKETVNKAKALFEAAK